MELDTPSPEFKEFAKIARLSREIVIDGTNAQVYIAEDVSLENPPR